MEEIKLKSNQYGGTKGCLTAHMLVNIWNELCKNCKDYRSGRVITAIDYSKDFNRVSYQHCLKAFKAKRASTEIIRLLTTFLTNRTMIVKVRNTRSDPKPANGGCPQGLILGVVLFNITTEDLEDEVCLPNSLPEFLRPQVEQADPPEAVGSPGCGPSNGLYTNPNIGQP